MQQDKVHAHIHQRIDNHVHLIQELVRQPSISLENVGLEDCANLVQEHLREAGASDASVIDLGDGYPGVWGSIDDGADRTILCYSHYDVRPVGKEEWTHDPFSGDLVPMGPYERVIVGRGSASSKGAFQAFLNAIHSIRAVNGRLPVNLMFLIEGAEILGSPNYLQLAASHDAAVQTASALYGPQVSQGPDGVVSVTLGYKGLVYLELEVDCQRWGRGPNGGPVHSATNAIVDNPAWRLVQALDSMIDAKDGRLLMPELDSVYGHRKPIQAWERSLVETLRDSARGADLNTIVPGLSATSPVSTFRTSLPPEDLLVEYMYGPSANLSGLRSGYTGPGTKSFLLPDKATATMDIRMVTELDAQEIVGALRRHLDERGYTDVRLNVLSAYNWGQTPTDSDLVAASLEVLSRLETQWVLWPMMAYGGPWAHLPRMLGIPGLRGAAPGLGGRAATSDEFMVIDGDGRIAGLETVEGFFADMLFAYAASANLEARDPSSGSLGFGAATW